MNEGTTILYTCEWDHYPCVEVRNLEVLRRVNDEEEAERWQVRRQQLVEVASFHSQFDHEPRVWINKRSCVFDGINMLYSTFIFERKANLKVENIAILYSRIQAIFQANGQASVYNELKQAN